MRAKSGIQNLLSDLQLEFDGTTDPQHEIYFSKLALLELGGWFEETYDEMLLSYARGCITNTMDMTEVERYIKKMSGFSYDYLRPALIYLIGMANINTIESVLDSSGQLVILQSELKTVWDKRCAAAHTTIVGAMPTYDAPSITASSLNTLYPLLISLETELNNLS